MCRSLILTAMLLAHLGTCVDAGQYNATTDADHVVGVYPISGQYGLLNRLLFYLLWIFVFCFTKWTWLVLGALAYMMTYSATAAVHALVLAITSTNGLYDLDAAGAWAILSATAMITPPIMWNSERLRDSVYRPVVGFWSTVVGTGCICCIVPFLRNYPQEPICRSNSSVGDQPTGGTLLTSSTQLMSVGQFDCSYSFFGTSQPLRNPSDITVVLPIRVYGTPYSLLLISCILTGILGVYTAVFGCCFVGDRRRTMAELKEVLERKRPHNSKQRRNYDRTHARARKKLETGKHSGGCRWLYLNAIILPAIVAFNEAYILATPLPSSEHFYAVGQWGSWVAVALASMAAAINAWYTPRWENLKSTLDVEMEERIQEKERKAIPRIHLDLETGSLSQEFRSSSISYESPGVDVASVSSRSTVQPTNAHVGQDAEDPSESSNLPVSNPVAAATHVREKGTDMHISEPVSNVTRTPTRIPRARNRLNNIQYDPPFVLSPVGVELGSMIISQYDVVCRAYDDVGRQHDAIIVRDIEGRDWVVQKGILWHRELWECTQSS